VPLDQLLIDVLACPIDKGPLMWFEEERVLYNPRLKKAYEVRDDIPILLVDEARDVGDAEHDRLMAKAAHGGVPQTGSAGRRPSEEAHRPEGATAREQAEGERGS
jgi:uncharacterized protein YbaR (Trm112 family)